MFMPPHSNSPYTGVHQPSPYSPGAEKPNPYSPAAETSDPVVSSDWRVPTGQFYDFRSSGPEVVPTGGITDDMLPTVWTHDDGAGEPVTLADGRTIGHTINLEQTTTEIMYDTSVTTADVLYAPGGGMVATPLPSGHRVEEVTLEVPVSHEYLYDMLFAVGATIDNRRALGCTIPEESRTVTTIGNEIVIRWEEHS